MLIDDDPLMTEVVQTYLEEAGYLNVVATNDPPSALETIRHENPDLLLLDLMMPGVGLRHTLRDSRRRGAQVPAGDRAHGRDRIFEQAESAGARRFGVSRQTGRSERAHPARSQQPRIQGLSGLPRLLGYRHGAAEPSRSAEAADRGDHPLHVPGRLSPFSISASTASSRSTTRWATTSATRCCESRPSACDAA